MKKKYGRLEIISDKFYKSQHKPYIKCLCSCGNTKDIYYYDVISGTTKSCGCITKKHGMEGTPTYKSWSSMKSRCNNKNNESYPNYGARGITVCEKWNDFKIFYEDMGLKPDGLTLDRIDNSKGYFKDNCRWSTIKEQNNNKRDTIKINIDNEIKTISQISEEYNIPHQLILQRYKSGYNGTDLVSRNKRDLFFFYEGKERKLSEIANMVTIPRAKLYYRLATLGLSMADAIKK